MGNESTGSESKKQVQVAVGYRGVEIGEGLMLGDFGPSVAYLEMPQPVPVGASLTLTVDKLELPVEILRVVEDVAGAERSPGVFVRCDTSKKKVAGWWKKQVSVEDPVIPESPLVGDVAPAKPEVEILTAAEGALAAIAEDVGTKAARKPSKRKAASKASAAKKDDAAPKPVEENATIATENPGEDGAPAAIIEDQPTEVNEAVPTQMIDDDHTTPMDSSEVQRVMASEDRADTERGTPPPPKSKRGARGKKKGK